MEIDIVNSLNTKQIEAINYFDGHLLVLAGAGTGKTKVLTHKIAEIIKLGKALPNEILAVTFTNKAAREMQERARNLLESFDNHTDGMWLGTFHSIAYRILRNYYHLVGLERDFVVIDADDQLRLIKNVLKDSGFENDKYYNPRFVLNTIQRLKEDALSIKALQINNINNTDQKILELYKNYQENLLRLNAVDFGDLLLYNVMIFTQNDALLTAYQARFKYLLIDEYQDTNLVQYLWLKLLSGQSSIVCCVGDEDQSIYGWRGAKIENILKFEQDFPGGKIIRLEQNYRSSPAILKAASSLISKNSERLGKTLWTESNSSEKIKIFSATSDKNEAETIAKQIIKLKSLGYELGKIAILFRSNSHTRLFEETLLSCGIPYQVIGGLRFYARQEIKDVIAYLRSARNLGDFLAFERLVNIPKRGVGLVTISKIADHLKAHPLHNIIDAINHLIVAGEIKGKAKDNLLYLAKQLKEWHESYQLSSPAEMAKQIIEESGYMRYWQEEKSIEAKTRIENIKELISALEDFHSLDEFLEHVSLVSDIDSESSGQMLSLMTIHAAKGLEFDVVFLPCWEEGIFPNQRTLNEENNFGSVEEERRLAYVAITRARKLLFISSSFSRRVFGQYIGMTPSRFISEIDSQSMEQFYTISTNSYKTNVSDVKKEFIQPKISRNGFTAGQKVFHQKFGYGKIMGLLDDQAEVYFTNAGYKTILTSFLKSC